MCAAGVGIAFKREDPRSRPNGKMGTLVLGNMHQTQSCAHKVLAQCRAALQVRPLLALVMNAKEPTPGPS